MTSEGYSGDVFKTIFDPSRVRYSWRLAFAAAIAGSAARVRSLGRNSLMPHYRVRTGYPGASVARGDGNRYDVALVLGAPYVEEQQ